MADGNVSIYGAANMSVDMTKDGNPTNSNTANKVSSNESFIGIKGSTDLGGGYAAVAQYESAIALDNGGAALQAGANTGSKMAARDSFLGIAGGFGTVLAGTHDTPYKMSTRGMDMFADTIADNRNLTSLHDLRVGNVLAYVSPKIANSLTIVGAVVMGAENMANQPAGVIKGSAYSLAGMYGSGPIAAALAYQSITVGTAGTGSLGIAVPVVLPANTKLSALKVGVGYTADQFGVNFVVERPTVSVPGFASSTTTNLYLGAKFNVSSTDAVKAAYNTGGTYGLGQTMDGEITGAQAGVANSSPSALSVGVKYAF